MTRISNIYFHLKRMATIVLVTGFGRRARAVTGSYRRRAFYADFEVATLQDGERATPAKPEHKQFR